MTRPERILIPLDGSSFSERALRLADGIRGGGAEATLLRVVGSAEEADRATDYREGVARAREGHSARLLVERAPDPALEILAEVERGEHDLVVLMTHGQTGIRRWFRGSVAEHVLRRCPVPLLLGTPSGDRFPSGGVRKVLVPLEGGETTHEVLQLVAALGLSPEAEVVLFTAVRTAPSDHTLAYVEELTAASEAAEERLAGQAAALEWAGQKASWRVEVGFPARAILSAAEQLEVDLIALATHGRTGFKRWLQGSVAEAVARSSSTPVLLLRAGAGVARSAELSVAS